MDRYALLCMFILVMQILWHGLIGALIFWNTDDNRVTTSNQFVHIDVGVFVLVVILFIIGHIALVVWLYAVPLKHRKEMDRKGFQFEQILSTRRKQRRNFARKSSERPPSSAFLHIPFQK